MELRAVADALKAVRDKTFVHIDKDGVFDAQSYYKKANLNNDDVGRVVRALWSTMRAVHLEVFGVEPPVDDYTGTDIKQFAKWRDDASA